LYLCLKVVSPFGKVKPILEQPWEGLIGPRRGRFPNFYQSAHEGTKVVRSTHRPPLPPHPLKEIFLVLISVRG